ncbi:hypothetical protein chiPu_0025984, partial [Chiloscyllium punctatum]|nr:hypothetical protein [Chiloscyllium punctatum]
MASCFLCLRLSLSLSLTCRNALPPLPGLSAGSQSLPERPGRPGGDHRAGGPGAVHQRESAQGRQPQRGPVVSAQGPTRQAGHRRDPKAGRTREGRPAPGPCRA